MRYRVAFGRPRSASATVMSPAQVAAPAEPAPASAAPGTHDVRLGAPPPPITPHRPKTSAAARRLALAHVVERLVESGAVPDYAAAGRALGVGEPRMCAIMAMLVLSPAIQDGILAGRLRLTKCQWRDLIRTSDWQAQLKVATAF